ncbi:MAG: Bax inhibitor-1/YccA family protein [Pseudolysinimonas sp.]|uniref:Bax inhibitor-1/YccA family protein n=1 Tax=Pseudolysinimonas sp. TaxID=2680009 RepID=UPI0032647F09
MANPVFNSSPAFSPKAAQRIAAREAAAPAIPTAGQLQQQFALPDATADQMERMTYQDTIFKTLAGFAVLLVGAALGWVFWPLAVVGLVVGLVLALVNTFKRKPSPALILGYALFEGFLVGGVSYFFSRMWDGIVPMALLGTLGVVGVTLALFASGKVRASKRATKVFLVAMVGYLAFSLINLGLMAFGVTDSMYGLRGLNIPGTSIPLGIPLGILVVLMAAYSLVLDFDFIKRGVDAGQPRIYGWTAAFGIMVTVVWLYFEILRLLSFFLPRN